ncbi:Kinesin domain-containing protein [Cephalotus follicularis]|uniref:Kinesin-like protein n=1 Tax=Cephalotus follicularis TaxID=3775 RepID=A0A1Q3ALS0_CEPFO|nr:Kinesin domain-containing protein [Cephalotus follicularis]
MEKICVAVRVRPPISQETANGTFWKVEDNRVSLHRPHGTPISGVSYAFDHVFDGSSTNSMVYDLLTKDIIHAAVDGFNGTAFAYGQTSSGKTFTMNGSSTDPGIIHRAVKHVFDKIHMMSDREFLIRVSYMEIYNEEINDLFAVENQKLQIHESLERGIFIAGLTEEVVNNAEQVLKLIESGEANRHFGETNMNVRSSRSHTIFRMVIESKRKETNSSGDCSITDAIRVSVLNLVDLAGSERIAKTGAGGVRLKEGKYINKSLMVLGNVINKLSDGLKQRGHIPYRDSKLTRILQPALGGNAKTSIICTVAPEEIHVEETKGTLQFASRAKRITNCAQVNEILTDAALLKRQKLEIEELRTKLQGSHAEVLEQEILKLRNDMLRYELERAKLEMELEEEKKSHKEREKCIREQQMKIENLSHLVTSSDCDRKSSEGQGSVKESLKEVFIDSNSRFQGDLFSTPCFKEPNAFVARRSNYSRLPDCSPLPDAFSNVADEDTWLKMNKGYIADLDSIQMTSARKVQSFPSIGPNAGCPDEVQDLKRELELVTLEKNEVERKHMEQVILNDQLMREISQLKQEALQTREIPQMLWDSVTTCKDIFEDVMLKMQTFVSEEKPSAAKLLSSTSEIGASLFSSLENSFSVAMGDHGSISQNDSLIQEHGKVLSERLKSTLSSLVIPETLMVENKGVKNLLWNRNYEDCTLEGQTTCWNKKQSDELSTIKEKFHGLEKELDLHNQLLEASRERYDSLEREFQLMKDERDSLLKTVSKSSQELILVTDQKENILRDLNTELQKRKHLEEEIKEFSVAFASRQRSLMSFHSEFKSKFEKLRAQNPVTVSKSLGC